jgi:transcriptional regulator with XRE-family HTH domain
MYIIDRSTKLFGEKVAQLRTRRRWSRAKFIARLLKVIEDNDLDLHSIGEVWLKRLENGEMVKIPRSVVDAIIQALQCSASEQADLLLCADRNILAGEGEPSLAHRRLNHLLVQIRQDAGTILNGLLDDHRAEELTETDQLELAATAMELAIHERRRRGFL